MLHTIALYHNQSRYFFPYEPGHILTPTISYRRELPDGSGPLDAVEVAWRLFNVDLDHLEQSRDSAVGEGDFLIASLYRLLGHRSLAVGDVVSVGVSGDVSWWACEAVGWRSIAAPLVPPGDPLTAKSVYTALRRRWARS